MDVKARNLNNSKSQGDQEEDNVELRRGPWTAEEDLKLVNYVTTHGEGRWDSLSRSAGLKRTGKSCRLRWLNYLRPDVRRGNISLQEQILIIQLYSRLGNRWSKIAQYLPGRTDNEIKNYWRTRVQKHAKQLKCDVNSKQFHDAMKYLWMPRLVERIQAATDTTTTSAAANDTTATSAAATTATVLGNARNPLMATTALYGGSVDFTYMPERSCTGATSSSDSFGTQVSPASESVDCYNNIPVEGNPIPDNNYFEGMNSQMGNNYEESLMINGMGTCPSANYFNSKGMDFQPTDQINPWMGGGDALGNLWNVEDFGFLNQQLDYNSSSSNNLN